MNLQKVSEKSMIWGLKVIWHFLKFLANTIQFCGVRVYWTLQQRWLVSCHSSAHLVLLRVILCLKLFWGSGINLLHAGKAKAPGNQCYWEQISCNDAAPARRILQRPLPLTGRTLRHILGSLPNASRIHRLPAATRKTCSLKHELLSSCISLHSTDIFWKCHPGKHQSRAAPWCLGQWGDTYTMLISLDIMRLKNKPPGDTSALFTRVCWSWY